MKTSKDKIFWERDAAYKYYRHGPLARTILGQQQVQGVDYAYTLQGWLKGVNSTSVSDGTWDMGQDGKPTGSIIARDAYGFSLNYFNNDYDQIVSTNPFAATTIDNELFNGNIGAISMNIPKLGNAILSIYRYDQLNRLVKSDTYNGLNSSTNIWSKTTIQDYREELTYDPNGNIKTYKRNGTGATLSLNNYSYAYTENTNRLGSVYNSVNTETKNYAYDEIGNTTADGMQGVTTATWNVYGKLQSLTNKDGKNVTYNYSADGQRISKKVGTVEEWYVKDAVGNIIATYKKDAAVNSGDLTVTEFYKYGSNLLSVKDAKVNVENILPVGIVPFARGNDNYVLSDANGNTKVTVSDKKLQHSSNGSVVDYYLADVRTATLHSSFGANAKTYNGGFEAANFNGQRKSLEIGGDAQTAQFWEYNGDVGRRWNVDPRPNVSISPYNCFAGNPILYPDKNGDSIPTRIYGADGKPTEIIPEKIQKMFNSEYGIKVGYNSKTGTLYYDGEIETTNIVSTTAKSKLISILTSTYSRKKSLRKYGDIIIGHNGLTTSFGTPVDESDGMAGELPIRILGRGSRHTLYWNIDAFKNDLTLKSLDFSGLTSRGYSTRTFNVAREFEHEFFGHGIQRRRDPSNGQFTAGKVEFLPNLFRTEMGLPLRANYGLRTGKGTVILFGINESDVRKIVYNYELVPTAPFVIRPIVKK